MKRKKEGLQAWHTVPKYIEPTTEGKCPYCGNHVKALEAHIRSKHKRERLPHKKR